MGKLILKDKAAKDIKKVGAKDLKKVFKKLDEILENPMVGKQLEGQLQGLRSYRAWPLRVLYSYDSGSQEITVFKIEYRGNVYK